MTESIADQSSVMKKRHRVARQTKRSDEVRVTKAGLQRLAERLGIADIFTSSDARRLSALCCKPGYPYPRVMCIDPGGVFSEERRRQIQREVTRLIRTTPIHLDDHDVDLSPADACGGISALGRLIRTLEAEHPSTGQAAFRRAGSVWAAVLEKTFSHWMGCVLECSHFHTSFHTGMLDRELTVQKVPGGPPLPLIKLQAIAPRQRRFKINGKARTAYQIGSAFAPSEPPRWSMLPPNILGSSDATASNLPEALPRTGVLPGAGALPGAGVPVFIQSHALNRLYERVSLPRTGFVAGEVIYQSLRNPVIVRHTRSGSPMLACMYGDVRLGYFIADLIDDAMVLRTFLSVTMDGTPEAARLHKVLRTGRYGVETMGLDRLGSILISDIHQDAELKEVLHAAGLEKLVGLAKTLNFPAHIRQARASHVRRYLGMPAAMQAGYDHKAA